MTNDKIITRMPHDLTLEEFLAVQENRPNARFVNDTEMRQYMTLQEEYISMANPVYSGTSLSPALEGLVLRLESDLGITLSGGRVQTWVDQSPFGNNVSAPAAINRVPYTEVCQNGKPCLVGDGVDPYYLQGSSGVLPTGNSNRTFIIGFDPDGGGNRIFGYGAAIDGQRINIGIATDTNIDVFAGQWGVSGFLDAPQILTIVFDSVTNLSDIDIYRNGILLSSSLLAGSDVVINTSDTVFNVMSNIAASNFFDGNGFFFTAWNKALSQSEREQSESYYANKYGISI